MYTSIVSVLLLTHCLLVLQSTLVVFSLYFYCLLFKMFKHFRLYKHFVFGFVLHVVCFDTYKLSVKDSFAYSVWSQDKQRVSVVCSDICWENVPAQMRPQRSTWSLWNLGLVLWYLHHQSSLFHTCLICPHYVVNIMDFNVFGNLQKVCYFLQQGCAK